MTSADAAALPAPPRVDLVVRSGLARGRVLFNRGQHWASHEAFEEAWRAAPTSLRRPIQGVIQAAAGLHKLLVQDNPVGADRLFGWAAEGLASVEAAGLALEVEPFLVHLEDWRARVGRSGGRSADPAGIPRLEWRADAPRYEVDSIEVWRLEATESSPGPVIIAIHAGGVAGWGEVRVSWDREGVWTGLTEVLAPALVGEQFAAPSELPVIWSDVAASGSVRAGAEAAAWDLFAKCEGVDLATAMGHAPRRVPLAGRVQIEGDSDDPLELRLSRGLARAADTGYDAVIVPIRPNHDRALEEVIRSSPLPVILDGARSYGRAHTDSLLAMGASGADLLMEPFGDCDVVLASRLRRALVASLSIPGSNKTQVEAAYLLRSADVFHLDPGRTGVTEGLRTIDYVAERGGGLWINSSAATRIGLALDLAVASRGGVNRPSEVPLAAVGTDNDARELNGGAGPAAGGGIGFEPDAALFADVVAYRNFRA